MINLNELMKGIAQLSVDMHMASTRPCQTCRKISDALGKPFGCEAMRMKAPLDANDLENNLFSVDVSDKVTVIDGYPGTIVPYEPVWRCEKCGRFHKGLWPKEGCDWCQGDKIAERMRG